MPTPPRSTKPQTSYPAATELQQTDHFLTTNWPWVLLWLFRAGQALFIVQGADVPDEWWQSTEVAEHVVFGRGQLTWEWSEGLRSYVYPLPFIVAFQVLKTLGIDTPLLVWMVPRLMAATTCYLLDRAIVSIARKNIYPYERAIPLSLLLTCTSWFTGFVGVRTQSNVAEALALLWAMEARSFVGFLLLCGFGCALRVTFVIPAMVLFFHRLQDRCGSSNFFGGGSGDDGSSSSSSFEAGKRQHDLFPNGGHNKIDAAVGLDIRRHEESFLVCVVRHLLGTGVAAGVTLGIIAAIDRVFYGFWVCSPFRFLSFNVLAGLSKIFGTHPIHWYLSQGLPLMLLSLLPMIALGWQSVMAGTAPTSFQHRPGCYIAAQRSRAFVIRLAQVIGFSTAVMSLLGHKEMRFLFFCVPLSVLIATACWATDATLWKRRRLWTAVHVVLNASFILFFGLMWQVAPLSVAAHLRKRSGGEGSSTCNPQKSFHALTHCFALPGESFFHGCVKEFVHNACPVIRAPPSSPAALSSSSPSDDDGAKKLRAEAAAVLLWQGDSERYALVQPTANDMFLENPVEFVEYVYEGKVPLSGGKLFQRRVDLCCGGAKAREMPDRVVMYDVHEVLLKDFLQRNNFVFKKSFFHSFIPLEEYQGKSMVLYERIVV